MTHNHYLIGLSKMTFVVFFHNQIGRSIDIPCTSSSGLHPPESVAKEGKGVIFTTTLIAWYGTVGLTFDETLYDDYLCLVALNKQKIHWTRFRRNPQEHWTIGSSYAGAISSNNEAVIEMKTVLIVQ